MAAFATLGAVLASKAEGAGQHVDISLMEVQAGSIDRRMSMLLAYQYNGEITGRMPLGEATGSGGYPSGVYPCEDGFFQITGGGKYFDRVRDMLGNPDELSQETNGLRPMPRRTKRWKGCSRPFSTPGCLIAPSTKHGARPKPRVFFAGP